MDTSQKANCMATNYPGFDSDDTAGDGMVTWQHSLDFVSGINDQTNPFPLCGTGKTDWRFPNVKELQSLIDYSQYSPALPSGHPFANVQFLHWSATTIATDKGNAWSVIMFNGFVLGWEKSDYHYVWPVRGGH